MGDPDQGYGPQQPGGWIYTTLPYVEGAGAYNIGQGLPWDQKYTELAKQMEHVESVFICPSRRQAIGYPGYNPDGKPADGFKKPHNSELPVTVAKTDYAINRGPGAPGFAQGGEPSADCLMPTGGLTGGTSPGTYPTCTWHTTLPTAKSSFDGVSAWRMGARMGQIIDGASKTILVGEKFLQPRFYELGYGDPPNFNKNNGGDNSSMYQGYDYDNARRGEPAQDSDDPDYDGDGFQRFGSAHTGSVNISFCDGSVQSIDYDVDENVFGEYVKRNNKDAL
jgi:prepilin-type processing-associated H-X9-DG protein